MQSNFQLHFKNNNMHYTWNHPSGNAYGMLVGRIWVSFEGEYTILNHKTNEKCEVKLHTPPKLLSKDPVHRVTCLIRDSNNLVQYVIEGTYVHKLERFPVLNPKNISSFKEVDELNLGQPEIIWQRVISP